MIFFKAKIPAYLYEKKNLIHLVLLTAVFALVFINIYKPFSSENWYNVSQAKFFFYSSLIILTGVLVVVISRIIMFFYARKKTISYGVYAIWILIEIAAMSVFYTCYTLFLNPEKDLMLTFKSSTINTVLVLLLPYSVLWLYFSWQDKVRKLQLLEENNPMQNNNEVFSFHDEKGEFRFSVKKDNLVYIESADNYVLIWYLYKGKLSKYMLRNSLKNMETFLINTNMVRCHRSFMVNFDLVKVIKRENNGVCLQMDLENVPDIPLSRTYYEPVCNRIYNSYTK
ncbi:MAG: LytTR family transcriptional regulator DNA-binding domain-containing protein [Bacteroidales bacterium]